MSKVAITGISGKRSLIAILSVLAFGAAVSFGIGQARAADNVSEDEIVRTLTPQKTALKRYLTDNFHIVPADLVTVGGGKSKLKDPGQSRAAVNRRVQVVNMENKTTASRERGTMIK